jgi:hypothetical protein
VANLECCTTKWGIGLVCPRSVSDRKFFSSCRCLSPTFNKSPHSCRGFLLYSTIQQLSPFALKTHNRVLLFGNILLKHGPHFYSYYWNQPLNMCMRVCYLDCHWAELCCYLVINTENLLHPLQLSYFHLWSIYSLSYVHTREANWDLCDVAKRAFRTQWNFFCSRLEFVMFSITNYLETLQLLGISLNNDCRVLNMRGDTFLRNVDGCFWMDYTTLFPTR